MKENSKKGIVPKINLSGPKKAAVLSAKVIFQTGMLLLFSLPVYSQEVQTTGEINEESAALEVQINEEGPELSSPAALPEKAEEAGPPEAEVAVFPPEKKEAREVSISGRLDKVVTLNVKDADIRKLLSGLAKVHGFSITIAPEVTGLVTVDFKDVKLLNAIDIILKDQGYGRQISGNILRVTTLEKLKMEEDAAVILEEAKAKAKQAEAAQRKAAEQAEPLTIRVFKLKFVDAGNVLNALFGEPKKGETVVKGQGMLSVRGTAAVLTTRQFKGFAFEIKETKAGATTAADEVEFERSKVLIVQDTPSSLVRIAEVIEEIDKEPFQILIDAKVVEIPIDQESRLGINWTDALNQWKITAGADAVFGKSYSRQRTQVDGQSRMWGSEYQWTREGVSDSARERSSSYQRDGGLSQSESYAQSSKYSLGDTETSGNYDDYVNSIADTLTKLTTTSEVYSAVLSASDFTLMLSAMKTDSSIVWLSNPRIIVQENYAAKIFVGERYPILKTEVGSSGGGAVGGTSVEEWREIGITLKVIPQVRETGTGGKGINMIIHPAVSKQSGFAYSVDNQGNQVYSSYPIIDIREADTNVTISDGDTIVIGGLIDSITTDEEDKVPLLGDIPILGYLFKEKYTALKKTNLLIFITAKIVEDLELSAYEKMMLEKAPPDALEDVRYVEDEDLRPYLYKSAKDPEVVEEEKTEEEEEEEESQSRKVTKAMKRDRNR